MRVYQGGTFIASQLTDASGKYEFTLLPSTYVVCEVLQPTWTQTFPTVGGNVVSCAGLDNTVTLAPLGYQFTVTNGSNEIDNDFGNYVGPVAGICPEDPTARLTEGRGRGRRARMAELPCTSRCRRPTTPRPTVT